MRVIKLILLNFDLSEYSVGNVSIFSEKIKRIFVKSDSIIYSLNFPFKIYCEDQKYSVYSLSNFEIDNEISSAIISLFSDNYFLNNDYNISVDSLFDVFAFSSKL